MTDAELLASIGRYHWYHIIKLTETVSTPGNPSYVPLQEITMRALRALDLKGKRVLDVGCRDGLFSFEAERLGATEVVGIDNDLSRGATEFLIPYFRSRVLMRQMNVYYLRPDDFGKFDAVIFPGVLYHLRYPFWGLRAIREVMEVGGHLLVETAVWEGERSRAVLFCPTGDETPYNEPTSCTFFNEKGMVDTVESIGFRHLGTELRLPRYVDPADSTLWRLKMELRRLVRRPARKPDPQVNRGVFHFVYEGYDRERDPGRYWDGVHDTHTLYGG